MKVMLELLRDVGQLLGAMNSLDEVRAEVRPQMRALLEALNGESGRLLATLPDHARREQMFQRALEAIANERFEDARQLLEAAVKHYPADGEFHNHLGLVAWEMGDLEAAERHYAHAMAVGFPDAENVDWFDARHRPFLRSMEGRALALNRLGRLKEALELFEALADMNPRDYAGCRYLAGEVHHLLGRPARALEHYALVPAEPAVLYNQALALFECGKRQQAVHVLLAGFVGNRHIAHVLLGRGDFPETSLPGFLASEAYAQDFAQACLPLWERAVGALEFLRRVYEHPLTQAHLVFCTQHVLDRVLEGGPAAIAEDWYAQLDERPEVESLVQRVLDVMDS